MASIWAWLSDERNRTVAGFLGAGLVAAFPAGFYIYTHYYSTLDTNAKMSDVCLSPKEEIDGAIHSEMQRHATDFVVQARRTDAGLEDKIETLLTALRETHADLRPYTIDVHFLYYLCSGIYSTVEFNASKRNKLNSLCTDVIIPEEQTELMRNASFEFAPDPEKIAGTWTGLYSYAYEGANGALDPVDFQIRIVRDGQQIIGATFEPNSFSPRKDEVPELFATIRGRVEQNGEIAFQKKYEGVDGVSHAIDYQGVYDSVGGTLRGTWRITSNPGWWGRFLMQKD